MTLGAWSPLALALLLGACSYAELTRTGGDRAGAEACGACHVEIYAEWRVSAHATAFEGRRYAEVAIDTPECAPCHAPVSIYTEGALAARGTRPHEGVDCISCHLDGDALVGPLPSSALAQPHPIVAEHPLYRTSALCGRCHEGTYAEWRAAPAEEPDGGPRRTCQECHMPAVTRTVTQATDLVSSILVAAERPHAQRRHRFDLASIDGFDGAAEVELTRVAEGVRVVVRNRLPHALPTGDYGERVVVARIEWRDAGGAVIGSSELAWSARLGTAIPAGGEARAVVAAPPAARKVVAVLLRPERPGLAGMEIARSRADLP